MSVCREYRRRSGSHPLWIVQLTAIAFVVGASTITGTAAAQAERTPAGAQAFVSRLAEDGLVLFVGKDPEAAGGYATAYRARVQAATASNDCATTLHFGAVYENRNGGSLPGSSLTIDWSKVTFVRHVDNYGGRMTDSVEIGPAPSGWLYFTLAVQRGPGGGAAEYAARLTQAFEYLRRHCDRLQGTGF